jgi:SAM-dependent methyltransferase
MSTPVARDATFAAGGAEPWNRVLGTSRGGALHLRRVVDGAVEETWAIDALCGPADSNDEAALGEFSGPLLDVGCGPGRMVKAAAARSAAALGIDVSADAVRVARADGTPALERSIFDRLPLEGQWRTVLLMDGNVGIGGDPTLLIARCRDLLAPGGVLVVETSPSPDLDVQSLFTVSDDLGNASEPFPWARVGWRTAESIAARAGMVDIAHVVAGVRHFVRAGTPRD